MIHSFTIQNFHSINDEVTISFNVDDNAPQTSKYALSPNGSRLSLALALIGPNASGKTTALKAIVFLQWFLTRSFDFNFYDELPFKKFAGNGNKKLPTRLSVVFDISGALYSYSASFSSTRIIKEELTLTSLAKKRITTKKIFTRIWDPSTSTYDLEDISFGLPEGFWRSKELERASLIAAASRFGHEYAGTISRYWRSFESNIDILDYGFGHGFRRDAQEALHYFGQHDELRKRAEAGARKYADLGISAFGAHGKIKHQFGNVEFDLDVSDESAGTRNYLGLSKKIEVVLENGGIAIIDEFDAFLHTRMFQSLLTKFFDPSINKMRGQVLFTTHNLEIFRMLDPKRQILLAEKNNGGATTLHQIKDRADANHLNRYLEGAYGAWPIINE